LTGRLAPESIAAELKVISDRHGREQLASLGNENQARIDPIFHRLMVEFLAIEAEMPSTT
jgi:hypothetical protein